MFRKFIVSGALFVLVVPLASVLINGGVPSYWVLLLLIASGLVAPSLILSWLSVKRGTPVETHDRSYASVTVRLTGTGQLDTNNESVWPLRIAAGAALTLITYLVGFAGWIALSPPEWIKYTTSVGGYERIALPDGSCIQLNTDSEIGARMTSQRREVELLRGEALIRVVHDARGPLTVSAANVAVQASPVKEDSVAFVVRVDKANMVDVSVTQGRVVLDEPPERFIDITYRRNSVSQSTLEEGDAVAVRPDGVRLTKVGLEDLNRELGWTMGCYSSSVNPWVK